MSLDRRQLLASSAAALAGLGTHGARATQAQGEVAFSGERTEAEVVLRAPNGQPILSYRRDAPGEGEPRAAVPGGCYTHPLYTPSGELVTDLAPSDHPHHRGIFCGWVALEGERRGDWWGWGAKAPKEGRLIVNREARLTEEGTDRVTLRLINSWRAPEAEVAEMADANDAEAVRRVTVLAERVTLTASQVPGANVVDYEFKLTVPTRNPVVIESSPFGGFCYRARPRGEMTATSPEGKIELKDAVFNRPEANWPSARWYDLSYRAEGGRVSGVAVMDHPGNPTTTWHVVRGIHMLNPCIVAGEPVTIAFGEPLYLRYRVVAHDGDAAAVDLNALWESFGQRVE